MYKFVSFFKCNSILLKKLGPKWLNRRPFEPLILTEKPKIWGNFLLFWGQLAVRNWAVPLDARHTKVLIQANDSLNGRPQLTSISWLLPRRVALSKTSNNNSSSSSSAASVMNWRGVGQRERHLATAQRHGTEWHVVSECTLRCNPGNYWRRLNADNAIHHRMT